VTLRDAILHEGSRRIRVDEENRTQLLPVIPAKAGIQCADAWINDTLRLRALEQWIPAVAGMTNMVGIVRGA
jgi:hypothetical protein